MLRISSGTWKFVRPVPWVPPAMVSPPRHRGPDSQPGRSEPKSSRMKRMPDPAKRSSFFSAEHTGNSGDLFPAERAGRTARRKEIDEILHPKMTHGGNREALPSWRLPSRGPVKRSKTDVVCLIANTAARTGHGGNR